MLSASLPRAAGSPPTREQLRQLWFDLAGAPMPAHAAAVAAAVGSDRIVYGSDCCWTPAPMVVNQVSALDSGASAALGSDWRELTTANAERLLGRDSGVAPVESDEGLRS